MHKLLWIHSERCSHCYLTETLFSVVWYTGRQWTTRGCNRWAEWRRYTWQQWWASSATTSPRTISCHCGLQLYHFIFHVTFPWWSGSSKLSPLEWISLQVTWFDPESVPPGPFGPGALFFMYRAIVLCKYQCHRGNQIGHSILLVAFNRSMDAVRTIDNFEKFAQYLVYWKRLSHIFSIRLYIPSMACISVHQKIKEIIKLWTFLHYITYSQVKLCMGCSLL